jgi:hypothetical protein
MRGTRRLRLLSAMGGFPFESVLDRQSSRLATAHAAWPRSRRAGTAAWIIGLRSEVLNDGHYRPTTASDATNRSVVAL